MMNYSVVFMNDEKNFPDILKKSFKNNLPGTILKKTHFPITPFPPYLKDSSPFSGAINQ
jgi:hypothetical protein